MSRFIVEQLSPKHEFDAFSCGRSALDEWLVLHARNATGQGTRTYVLVEPGAPEVRGYFALAAHLVQREVLPKKLGRGGPRQVPAILLAKLALDESLQGDHLGGELLIQAVSTALAAARVAGGKVLVVDAIDAGAAAFYSHHDFVALAGDNRRLVMKLSTAARALEVPWP